MRCSRLFDASTALRWKIGFYEPIPRSPRKGSTRAGHRPRTPPPPPPVPTPLESNHVPTARNVAVETAIRRRVAPLPPNWQRFFNSGSAASSGASAAASFPLHTCERDSHPALVYSSYIQQLMIGTRRALLCHMKYAWLGCLLFGGLLSAGTQDSEFNVNSRYTVEAVVVAGVGWTATVASVADRNEKISPGLGKEIAALIGEKLNPSVLDDLAHRLRKEFHARTVEHHVVRGKTPDYVQVVFDVKLRPTRFDVTVPKFLYNGKQGWSGAVEGTATIRHNGFTLGLVSDGDELAERYAGLVARYENTKLGTDRMHFGFQFETYHEQWNRNTLAGLPTTETATALEDTSGAYRTRQNFQPEVTFVLAKPLTLSVGASFERFQDQLPAAPTESANALITTLRYHRRLEDSENQHDLDAGYNLRAATKLLNSDFVYAATPG